MAEPGFPFQNSGNDMETNPIEQPPTFHIRVINHSLRIPNPETTHRIRVANYLAALRRLNPSAGSGQVQDIDDFSSILGGIPDYHTPTSARTSPAFPAPPPPTPSSPPKPQINIRYFTTPTVSPADDCPICQDPYDNAEHVAICLSQSSCNHVFGHVCIETWVNSGLARAWSCPICRQSIAGALEITEGYGSVVEEMLAAAQAGEEDYWESDVGSESGVESEIGSYEGYEDEDEDEDDFENDTDDLDDCEDDFGQDYEDWAYVYYRDSSNWPAWSDEESEYSSHAQVETAPPGERADGRYEHEDTKTKKRVRRERKAIAALIRDAAHLERKRG